MGRKFEISDALISLVPGAEWVLRGDNYNDIEWLSTDKQLPIEEDVMEEVKRLQLEHDNLQYQRLRAKEYPDFRDYLDGIVKSDQEQIDAYISACQAVKDKYPKP
jgi:hypothetical protein